jgi:acyl transferase domain-containing protein/NAD(P)H-dependent flavin oxidoreductase YrpB (nitropropane dioxygenase family)
VRIPRIITTTPVGLLDVRMAVAGSRAGALGTLDLGVGAGGCGSEARSAIERTSTLLGNRQFGIRVEAWALAEWDFSTAPENLAAVVAWGEPENGWAPLAHQLRSSGRIGLAEVTTRADASLAVAAGFDRLIVAGNEAGGLVGDDSSFVLLQAVLGQVGDRCSVWVRGGIGPFSAAACVAAGATGVVLDGALLLARETSVPQASREVIGAWDGVETTVIGRGLRTKFRAFLPPLSSIHGMLDEKESGSQDGLSAIREVMRWGEGQAWPVGQDSALAADLASRFVTVGGIVQAVERAIDEGLAAARSSCPLSEASPLARSHGTKFPIVQGPMTRVSDRPEFARAVADAGALPMLALAMMRRSEVEDVLRATRTRLGERPWGVGMLGFLPPEHRRDQTEAILQARPPFVLIAGGRPDQAREFEEAGIATYLHAPSPLLLAHFLRDGARRFVLEGCECGGHVGPRSSFLLWEQAARVILDHEARGIDLKSLRLLYAGGIHDARSAAAVAAVAAPLEAAGVHVGVLVGTAYLFTAEAVRTGAIVEGFQQEALSCQATALLETGPGHQVRVSPTPFLARFEEERLRLIREGKTKDEIREHLEGLNVGRLRIAAKGLDRSDRPASPLESVDPADQRERGLYMLGQAATLRNRLTTIDELHQDLSAGATAWLEERASAAASSKPRTHRRRSRPSNVAIVGMSAIVPGAVDVRGFWENTLRSTDAITEVPADRWDWRIYFDADPKAPDKIISRWGGFVPEIPFDPLRYGMPPNSLTSVEPLHLLTLEAVRAALDDAGYGRRPFARERTSVVLGAGGGAAQLAMGYAFRSYLPLLDTVVPGLGSEAMERCGALLPEWTEDSFPGILLNVAAGRVANRFDLGGANYTVDAACGSSLAAAALAVRELESESADVVVLGGADTVQNPLTYLAFSKTQAFSSGGRCRPFDARADGIVISEAVAVLVLKRLADAERDGDRIYAVIKGLGASSDGRAKGLTAPRFEGQVRALRRAYEKAGVSPSTVGYVEAHGTGTAAGDLAEVQALTDVFQEAGAEQGRCALGSVKSQIGHTKCAAGLAGLINAALALYHRVLPPTLGVEKPNPRVDFPSSPFHLSTRARPWLRPEPFEPRRAGVSAFGFGGTNFHGVMEAYEGDPTPHAPPQADWPAELLVWQGPKPQILDDIDRFARALDGANHVALRDVAHALARRLARPSLREAAAASNPRLAIIAASLSDLREKLGKARSAIADGLAELHDPTGVEFSSAPRFPTGKVAFLFPGQGSQVPGMLEELTVALPALLETFEKVDRHLVRQGRPPIGPLVFPPPTWSEDEAAAQRRALGSPEIAQPALGAASVGLLDYLGSLGLRADLLGGHSYGELVALHAAGVYPLDSLIELSVARGKLLLDAVGDESGTMAALATDLDQALGLIGGAENVVVANCNGPSQTVISGPHDAVSEIVAVARARGIRAQPLAAACAFHSPLVRGAEAPLSRFVAELQPRTPSLPVFSNLTAAPYPSDPAEIARQVGAHAVGRVKFGAMVEAMYEAGARVFVEVGPGHVLTSLVGSILANREHLAVACQPPSREGITGLLTTVGRLFAAGLPMDFRSLTMDRSPKRLSWESGRFEPFPAALSPSTWLVNGNRARPAFGPEPPRFGPGPALPKPRVRPSGPETAGRVSRNGKATVNGTVASNSSPPAAPAGSQARVLAAYQSTMRTFLETQRSTMLNYLAGGQAVQPSTQPTASEPPKARVIPDPCEVTSAFARESALENLPHAPGQNGKADLERRLFEIVRDRTGYPTEMLDLGLDIETDLGIDSIKRVEILGTLRESFPERFAGSESTALDQLTRARTLGAIVEYLGQAVAELVPIAIQTEPTLASIAAGIQGSLGGQKPILNGRPIQAQSERGGQRSHEPATQAATEGSGTVRRMVLEAVDAPIRPGTKGSLVAGGTLIVTDDRRGVAELIVNALRRQGFRTLLLRHSDTSATSLGPESSEGDLGSPEFVRRFGEYARSLGPVTGLVHALPLRDAPEPGLEAEAWSNRMRSEVMGLFLLAREFGEDLRVAGEGAGASLVAATAIGGGYATVPEGTCDFFFPGHGAIAGLVKTLAREWRSVRARAVDFSRSEPLKELAERLVDELNAADRRSEVGYVRGRRVSLSPVVENLLHSRATQFDLSEGDPIVVTGGARGITAAVLSEFARRWKPRLLLLGTSPPPSDGEPLEPDPKAEPTEVKAWLYRRFRSEGIAATPVELEKAYRRLLRDREIRGTLRRLRDLGSAVEYEQVDVRNAGAVESVLDAWRSRFGPAVGLIHGAGVIHDKLLRDKSVDSIDEVIGTKLIGAINLSRHFDAHPPRFVAFFSSVAGRFGNRGQSDYAAANEALNKLAIWLDRRWPGRVVSMIWGPWSGVGMVSDLEGHLGRRGMVMIDPGEGCARLADELQFGRKGDVEVIVAGDLGTLTATTEHEARATE